MDFIKMIMELPGEKRSQDVVEHTEWNSLWKLIVTQGNHSENYLEQLYDYFFNKEEGWVHKVQAELDGVQPYVEGAMTQPVGKAPDGSLWTYPSTESGTVPWGNVMGDITKQQDLIQKFNAKSDVGHGHDINTLTFNEGDIDSSWINYSSQSVPTSALENLSVTTEKLNNGAVTSAKIASGAVINDSIANGSVSGAKIADDTITRAKLADHAVSVDYTATLNTTWSGSAAPYTKEQKINGILETDKPLIDIVPSATFADAEKQADAWALIYRAVTAANKITFYAKAKPTVSIPLQIRCIRK